MIVNLKCYRLLLSIVILLIGCNSNSSNSNSSNSNSSNSNSSNSNSSNSNSSNLIGEWVYENDVLNTTIVYKFNPKKLSVFNNNELLYTCNYSINGKLFNKILDKDTLATYEFSLSGDSLWINKRTLFIKNSKLISPNKSRFRTLVINNTAKIGLSPTTFSQDSLFELLVIHNPDVNGLIYKSREQSYFTELIDSTLFKGLFKSKGIESHRLYIGPPVKYDHKKICLTFVSMTPTIVLNDLIDSLVLDREINIDPRVLINYRPFFLNPYIDIYLNKEGISRLKGYVNDYRFYSHAFSIDDFVELKGMIKYFPDEEKIRFRVKYINNFAEFKKYGNRVEAW